MNTTNLYYSCYSKCINGGKVTLAAKYDELITEIFKGLLLQHFTRSYELYIVSL